MLVRFKEIFARRLSEAQLVLLAASGAVVVVEIRGFE